MSSSGKSLAPRSKIAFPLKFNGAEIFKIRFSTNRGLLFLAQSCRNPRKNPDNKRPWPFFRRNLRVEETTEEDYLKSLVGGIHGANLRTQAVWYSDLLVVNSPRVFFFIAFQSFRQVKPQCYLTLSFPALLLSKLCLIFDSKRQCAPGSHVCICEITAFISVYPLSLRFSLC